MAELKAFFGLLYLWASLKSNLSLADVIWYHESSNDLFVATMSMKRFQFIGRFIEFDVIKTREERWKHNKFASMRYIWWCELQICQRSKPKAVSSDNLSFKFISIEINLSNNITGQNLLSMDFCTAHYVMLAFHTLTAAYHTLESLT